MNRIDRLSAILIMLQTKKVIKAEEIANRFEISLRTVYRDMKALNEAGVPLGSEAGIGYYLVEGYHLPPVMFTPEEAGALVVGAKLINKFTDFSVQENYNLAIDKIKAVLPDTHKEFIGNIDQHIHILHQRQQSENNFADNYISTIQKALSGKKCLSIEYLSKYKNEYSHRIIEPLGLCFYGYCWHLIAFCHLRNDYRDFRLDRIKSCMMEDLCSEKSEGFSISQYFKNLWENEAVLQASVIFEKTKAQTISQSKYYFGFYEENINKETIEMKFVVNDYDYIAYWLISLGNMVTSISPPELYNKVAKIIESLTEQYLASQTKN